MAKLSDHGGACQAQFQIELGRLYFIDVSLAASLLTGGLCVLAPLREFTGFARGVGRQKPISR